MILLSKVGCSGIRAVAHRWRARMILQRRTGGPRVRMAPHLDAVLSSRARLILLGSMAGPGGWLLQRPAHRYHQSLLTDAHLLKARVNTAKQSSHVPNY